MVLPGLLSMTYQAPFDVTQDCQPRGGLNCGELGPPTSNISFSNKGSADMSPGQSDGGNSSTGVFLPG